MAELIGFYFEDNSFLFTIAPAGNGKIIKSRVNSTTTALPIVVAKAPVNNLDRLYDGSVITVRPDGTPTYLTQKRDEHGNYTK